MDEHVPQKCAGQLRLKDRKRESQVAKQIENVCFTIGLALFLHNIFLHFEKNYVIIKHIEK